MSKPPPKLLEALPHLDTTGLCGVEEIAYLEESVQKQMPFAEAALTMLAQYADAEYRDDEQSERARAALARLAGE